MKILLSNDDGYFAEGIVTLALALAEEHDVRVSAPAAERSGAGHALTFNRAFKWTEIAPDEMLLTGADGKRIPFHAVHGSPADAVKFALEYIYRDEKFDLVISGINSVPNIGSDIIYSGTFGAAEEGSVLGVPSVAVSAAAYDGGYALAAEFVKNNLSALHAAASPYVTVNVNVPSGDRGKIKGVAVVPLGIRRYNDWYEHDGSGGCELFGSPGNYAADKEETDCKMFDLGYITVTPVRVLCTDEESVARVRENGWKI